MNATFMDSVSQFVLGSAVCSAALGARTSAVRAVLWGGVIATLPDLDILFEHGDAIQNMTRHRAESHSLLYLTLAAPLLAFGIAALHRERALFRRWWLGVWLALFTHPLLDALTIYGTQLWLPFSEHPVAIGSLSVVDPLYTLPLLVGVVALCIGRGGPRSRKWNLAGLVLSTGYAAWSLFAQQQVAGIAERSLAAAGIHGATVQVSPAPFQTLLWRAVAGTKERAYEGMYSLCDAEPTMHFESIELGVPLLEQLRGNASVDRLTWFAGGFVKAVRVGDDVQLTDLRMGMEPNYVFTFVVGHFDPEGQIGAVAHVKREPFRFDVERGIPWLWRRMFGDDVPPPR
jgi:inner membrane protein